MVVALILAFILCLVLVIALKDDEDEMEEIKTTTTRPTKQPIKCMLALPNQNVSIANMRNALITKTKKS